MECTKTRKIIQVLKIETQNSSRRLNSSNHSREERLFFACRIRKIRKKKKPGLPFGEKGLLNKRKIVGSKWTFPISMADCIPRTFLVG